VGIFLPILAIIFGFILLSRGADKFVSASSNLANRFGVSELIIGATIVSFGTTLPELISAITAVVMGASNPHLQESFASLAVGAAIGSVLFNTAIVLSIVVLIRPQSVNKSGFIFKGILLICSALIVTVFVVTGGGIYAWQGVLLLVVFFVFITSNVIEASKQKLDFTPCPLMQKTKLKSDVFALLFGIIAITLGAYTLIKAAEIFGATLGIPAQIIGLVVVAGGTSLPELVTSLTALKKGKTDIGVGNIIGANIINLTLILGSSSVVSGTLAIDVLTRNVVIFFMLLVVLILVIPVLFTGKIKRWQACLMMLAYFSLLVYNIFTVMHI
jgi:cation:H+ antiporter